MQHLDRDASGPKAYCGPIGKQLQNCEHLPVVDFNKITPQFLMQTKLT